MSRYLSELQRSVKLKFLRVFFKGGEKRQLQERADIHRLFLFTSLQQQKHLLEGQLPEGFTEHIIQQANSTPYEEQRDFVQQQLRSQLVDIGSSIHQCLVQANDPRPSATAFEQAWQQRYGPSSSSSSSSSRGVSWSSGNLSVDTTAAAAVAAAAAGQGPLLSQHDLSNLVQQRLGYSLAVRQSLIKHQDAGLGLFVEGHAVPGSLVALFPGLVYHKHNYRRMPGYPRLDIGNPYLTARYDGGIIDSMPWGRGWQAEPQASPIERPLIIPSPKGFVGRLVSASDGPKLPIPEHTNWIHPTSGEAAHLELLEGRHPLALAHFANHPPAGAVPNTVIANFKFKMQLPAEQGVGMRAESSGSSGSSSGSSSSSNSSGNGVEESWLRAYVPNIEYTEECSHQKLLSMEVSCVGLVAVQPLSPGTEVLFNYRLSPALRGRPAWYVPVNAAEENMRWA